MTPGETKKKEEIVKSLKKKKADFTKRYGKRAKEVMYAVATKQAKNIAEETLDEKKKEDENKSKKHFKRSDVISKIKKILKKEDCGETTNSNVSTGKTMTGQTKDSIDTTPKQKDGILSGA